MPGLLYALKMRMDACVQMLEHHIISVNEDAVEFKKDNGSFHIRSYNLMEQTITNFQNGDLSLNRDTSSLLDSRKAERKGVGFELFISFVSSPMTKIKNSITSQDIEGTSFL